MHRPSFSCWRLTYYSFLLIRTEKRSYLRSIVGAERAFERAVQYFKRQH